MMLTPKNIIYGFCKSTRPPKYKYLISLYRSETLHVIACFTTSQPRSGQPLEKVKYGANRNSDNEVVSYVFKANIAIGDIPGSDKKFRFPRETVIRFDYNLMDREHDEIMSWFVGPKVVGVLSDEEYENIIYAMMYSDDVPEKYKIIFNRILVDLGQKKREAQV